jgi:3-hydroxyisobutyrate dehydrogenase-like beta-hydroxyacid dehydrogenase
MLCGFIGVGAMGGTVARNLIRSGRNVLVHDLNPEAVAKTVAAGKSAREAKNLAEMADVDVLFTSLPFPDTIRKLMLGATGLISQMKPGVFYIDISTIDIGLAKELDTACLEKEVKFLGCPQGRTPVQAEKAEQPIYAGGKKEDYETMLPILESMGKPVYLGNCEASYACKLIGNIIGIMFLTAISEGFKIAEKIGMDLELLYKSLEVSGATSAQLASRGHMIVKNDFTSSFNLELALKDIKLGCQMAEDTGVDARVVQLAKDYFDKANKAGLGKEDCMAVYKVIESK